MEPLNGTEPDKFEKPIRVVVELFPRPNGQHRVAVQGNAPWTVLAQVLKDAIVALAQQAVRDEDKTLVKPVTGVPPLRRLP